MRFKALAPRKQQQLFPDRIRSVKHKASPLPHPSESQDTLTQRGFAITPSASREVSHQLSDDDFEEPPPKRRKTRTKPRRGIQQSAERDPDQTSMTQYDRGEVPFLRRKSKLQDQWSEDIEIEDSDDHEQEQGIAWKLGCRKNESPRNQGRGRDTKDTLHEEVPESSHPPHESSWIDDTAVQQENESRRTEVRTPRKIRFVTEVQSSQTPPSTKSSTRSTVRTQKTHRSPLQERSGNIQTKSATISSPKSQNISMKMLERVRFGKRMMRNDQNIRQTSPPDVRSTIGINEQLAHSSSVQTPSLTTVEDSLEATANTPGTRLPMESPEPPRKLTRITTVQDSQVEDLDLESLDGGSIVYNDDNALEVEESQFVYDDYSDPATFDPGYLALDRDAARYGQTQAQHPVYDDYQDSETDVEDLQTRFSNQHEPEEISQHSTDDEDNDDSEKPKIPDQQLVGEQVDRHDPQPHDAENVAADDNSSPKSMGPSFKKGIYVSSSPPPPILSMIPRPSQESTVVPTQNSLHDFPSSHPGPPRSPHEQDGSMGTQAPSVTSTPQKLFSTISDTFPSSPLPMPPSSPLHKAGASGEKASDHEMISKNDMQFESLVDFSLPPPPPISSNRRQTPQSSFTSER